MATLTNKSDVIANFARYHGREPNPQELAPGGLVDYLTTKPPREVEQLLAKNSPITKGLTWDEYQANKESPDRGSSDESSNEGSDESSDEEPDGSGLGDDQKAALNKLNEDIDNMDISLEQKAILKEIAGMDFTGDNIPTVEEMGKIIDTAATNAETDLSPYYEKVTGRELEDFKNQMEDIRSNYKQYAEREKVDYNKKLQQAKQNLRASGRTFGGLARGTLGKEAAIDNKGVEGEIPEARRMEYEQKVGDIQSDARDMSIKAERQLGTANVPGFGSIKTPYGDRTLYKHKRAGEEGYEKTGDIQLDKIKEKEKSVWNRVSKYKP